MISLAIAATGGMFWFTGHYERAFWFVVLSIISGLVLLRHKRRRFDCRMQQGQRERFRAMATMSLRRIVAIEFGM